MYKNYIIKFSLILLLLTLGLVSCNKKNGDFRVSGQLENISGSHFLAAYEVGNSLIVDTVPVDNGEFSFRGKVDTLTIMRLYFNKNTKVPDMYLFVDRNWHVKMNGNILYPDLIEVSGGDVNDDLTSFKKKNETLLLSRAEILEAAGKDSSSAQDDQKYIMELKNVNFELSNIAASYVKNNPDKIASVVLINTFFRDETSIPRLDESLNLLKGKAENFPLTNDLKEYSSNVKRSSVGASCPSFNLKDKDGNNVSPFQYRGKYLLLSFVSTTCETCKMERQDAIRIYNDLRKKKENIEFLTIVIDSEIEEIPKTAKDSIKWTLLADKGSWASKTFDLYNVREVPYNILISPTGTILERDLPILALTDKLKELTSDENKQKTK
mgnify:CR=1 FL=1